MVRQRCERRFEFGFNLQSPQIISLLKFLVFYFKFLYLTVVIDADEYTKWIKLNAGQVGFYRVNYNNEWTTFEDLLQSHHTVMSQLFRLTHYLL